MNKLYDAGPVRAARAVAHARRVVRPIVPPSQSGDCTDLLHAYRAQQVLDEIGWAAGERPAGYKVGLTNAGSQEAFGTGKPVRGTLTRSMVLDTGATLDLRRFVAPRVEAELAFIVGRPIGGCELLEDEIVDAVASIAPALEVVDSRLDGWASNAVDLVADAGAAAAAVLGEPVPFDHPQQVPDICVLDHGSETLTGTGDAVQGGPLTSLIWLVRDLAGWGRGLDAGDIVLAGTWTPPWPVPTATVVRADFGPLGTAEATFA